MLLRRDRHSGHRCIWLEYRDGASRVRTVQTSPDASPPNWRQRLELIVETMREMSLQTDPQAMVSAYRRRMQQLNLSDGMVALSRRDLPAARYRITRSSRWEIEINPWTQVSQLPELEGGLLG